MELSRTFRAELSQFVLSELNKIREEEDRYAFGSYRSGDEAPAYLRSRLPEKFRDVPLVEIRKAVHNQSNRLSKPVRKRSTGSTPREKLTKITSGESKLSPEFIAYEKGEVWSARAKAHREFAEWHCQVCGKEHFKSGTLHVHHNTYGQLDGTEPTWSLIAVCGDTCHPVCDFLRREAKKDDSPELDLFRRSCERCSAALPADWQYTWCKECGETGTCHHGNRPKDCNDCMIESDLAYDAGRLVIIPTHLPKDKHTEATT